MLRGVLSSTNTAAQGGLSPLQTLEGSPSSGGGWRAHLSLEVELRGSASVLSRNAHSGPMRVQRPFYPEGTLGSCHLIILHPPGGVVGGDELSLQLQARNDVSALLTTPGATKLYRAHQRAPVTRVTQHLLAGTGATVEWLPQETIAFEGCDVRLSNRIDLASGATYAGWDILCLGRPAANEQFHHGRVQSELSIWRVGSLRFIERARYHGGDPILLSPWGLHGQPVVGTFVIASPRASADWVEVVRQEFNSPGDSFAVTLLPELFVARYIGPSTREARAIFERVFCLLRPYYLSRAAVLPRIWRT